MNEGFPQGSKRSHLPVKIGRWTRGRADSLYSALSQQLYPPVPALLIHSSQYQDGLMGEGI